jgi:hypothetical protein
MRPVKLKNPPPPATPPWAAPVTGRRWPDVVAEAMTKTSYTVRFCICALFIGGSGSGLVYLVWHVLAVCLHRAPPAIFNGGG